jgi:hypothetical protein
VSFATFSVRFLLSSTVFETVSLVLTFLLGVVFLSGSVLGLTLTAGG